MMKYNPSMKSHPWNSMYLRSTTRWACIWSHISYVIASDPPLKEFHHDATNGAIISYPDISPEIKIPQRAFNISWPIFQYLTFEVDCQVHMPSLRNVCINIWGWNHNLQGASHRKQCHTPANMIKLSTNC